MRADRIHALASLVVAGVILADLVAERSPWFIELGPLQRWEAPVSPPTFQAIGSAFARSLAAMRPE